MISKLRAALTPQSLLLMFVLLFLAAVGSGLGENERVTDLERRIGYALSKVEGAGEVQVVISMRAVGEQQAGMGIRAQTEEQIPSGAIAVAQGAGDPFVCAKLSQALCALLGLPASAVSVIEGGAK